MGKLRRQGILQFSYKFLIDMMSSISQQLETLKKVMDSSHEAQIKEVTARHEK